MIPKPENSPARIHRINSITFLILSASLFFLGSCSVQAETFTPDPALAITPPPPEEPLPSATPTQALIAPPFDTWLDPVLPESVQSALSKISEFNLVSSKEGAKVQLTINGENQAGSWTYLVAAPFYAQLKDIQLSDLQAFWTSGVFDPANYDRLYLSEETSILFSQLWGEPSPDSVIISDPDLIPESIWIYPRALAIIPFEELLPSYSIIPVNGSDPLGSSYDDSSYPLSFPIYLEIIDPDGLEPIQIPTINNFDPAKLTSVALTGVTALVRDTAAIMEEKGILYPGEQIKDILISADIAHINNEVPFAEDCPPPDPNLDILSFCSDDTYIALLESVGADIIELSGDHFADKGPGAMLHSLELYEQNGYLTYGGGENLQAGLDPLLIEHNANRLAFIGCNAKADEMYATASETNPGASRCDFDWMAAEIQRLSSQGYLVIATMQHEEIDSFFPVALQLNDFHRLADAGAVIVSGSQAHHPQGFELSDASFIHYGLGNLFFDQWYLASYNPEQHINKDKAMIDIHYFYDGSYLNTRLVYLQFVDNAQPRPMTSKEETSFIADLYQSSKWNDRWIYLYPAGYFTTTENQ